MSTPRPAAPDLWVACLCAQWCGTCRDYRAIFEEVTAQILGVRAMWVDIEELAKWVDPVEVDDFPTLLIVRDGEPLFFGPVTPRRETLSRLLQAQRDPHPSPAALATPGLRGLASRLAALSR